MAKLFIIESKEKVTCEDLKGRCSASKVIDVYEEDPDRYRALLPAILIESSYETDRIDIFEISDDLKSSLLLHMKYTSAMFVEVAEEQVSKLYALADVYEDIENLRGSIANAIDIASDLSAKFNSPTVKFQSLIDTVSNLTALMQTSAIDINDATLKNISKHLSDKW